MIADDKDHQEQDSRDEFQQIGRQAETYGRLYGRLVENAADHGERDDGRSQRSQYAD